MLPAALEDEGGHEFPAAGDANLGEDVPPGNSASRRLLRAWQAQGLSPGVEMEILGHSQIRVTMNTYSRVTPASSREAAARVEGFLLEGHSEARTAPQVSRLPTSTAD